MTKATKKKRSKLVLSVRATREKLGEELGEEIYKGAQQAIKTLVEVMNDHGLNVLPEGCGSAVASRVAAARILLEAGGIIGPCSKTKIDEKLDGQVQVVVSYSNAEPDHCDDSDDQDA
jgi:hypothetical protein